MAIHLTLTQAIGVRVPVPQPFYFWRYVMKLILEETDIQNVEDQFIKVGYHQNKIYFQSSIFNMAEESEIEYINNIILGCNDFFKFENYFLVVTYDNEYYTERNAYLEGLYLVGYIEGYLKEIHMRKRNE